MPVINLIYQFLPLLNVEEASLCYNFHFFEHVRERFKKDDDLLFGDDEKLGLLLRDCHSPPYIPALVEEHFNVAKVATLDAHVDWDVLGVLIRLLAENVIVQLHSAFDDEEDFLSRVVLPVEGVILIDLHLAEEGQHLPDKLLVLVVKEADLAYDLAVGVRDDLTFEVRWQLIYQLLLVELLEMLVMIVLEEAADFLLDLGRQSRVSLHEILHR